MARPHGPHSNMFFVGIFGRDFDTSHFQTAEDTHGFIREHTGRTDLKIGKAVWFSHFRPNIRMVNKFGEGRVFVVGDAAHVHTPAGGQGTNSSIQDSVNLGWKLALVLKGLASPSLLSTFTEERLPVIAEMLAQTTQMFTRLMYQPPKGEEARPVFRLGNLNPAFSMLGVNYRWSPIVLDERTTFNDTDREKMKTFAYGGYSSGVCAGDAAPDAPGLIVTGSGNDAQKEFSLFEFLDYKRHSILVFTPPDFWKELPEEINKALKEVSTQHAGLVQTMVIVQQPTDTRFVADCVAVDAQEHATSSYEINNDKPTIIIIRPDGYIGAILTNTEAVVKYFAKIFV